MRIIVTSVQDYPDGNDRIEIVDASGFKVEDGVLMIPERGGSDIRCFPLVNVRDFKVRK